jgi:hypothetical protein
MTQRSVSSGTQIDADRLGGFAPNRYRKNNSGCKERKRIAFRLQLRLFLGLTEGIHPPQHVCPSVARKDTAR